MLLRITPVQWRWVDIIWSDLMWGEGGSIEFWGFGDPLNWLVWSWRVLFFIAADAGVLCNYAHGFWWVAIIHARTTVLEWRNGVGAFTSWGFLPLPQTDGERTQGQPRKSDERGAIVMLNTKPAHWGQSIILWGTLGMIQRGAFSRSGEEEFPLCLPSLHRQVGSICQTPSHLWVLPNSERVLWLTVKGITTSTPPES